MRSSERNGPESCRRRVCFALVPQRLAGLMVLLCAGFLLAQSPSSSTPASDTPPPPPAAPASKTTGARTPNNGSTAPPIRVNVNEVIVPVTVTDDKGRFVSDLDQKDFQVFEDNKPQQIEFFTRERNQPVVIGFLIDLSASSRVHWKNYQDAAIELVQTLLTDEKKFSGYLISYSQDAELQANTTSDPENIIEKLRKLKPGSGSALFDAIYMSCTNRKLVHGEPIQPRRVVIIIGDGHDDASKRTIDQVIELAAKNQVTIYCISTAAFGFNNIYDQNLVRLAEETGGRVFYPLENVYKDTSGYLSQPSDDGNYALKVGTGEYASAVARGMYHSVAAVAGEVTTQYIIRYVPQNDNGKAYRNLKVVVDLANVKVRARKGYYASAP
ncbi:MAG: VWA domain-containing protein [Bryobacteraceae bacterium]